MPNAKAFGHDRGIKGFVIGGFVKKLLRSPPLPKQLFEEATSQENHTAAKSTPKKTQSDIRHQMLA